MKVYIVIEWTGTSSAVDGALIHGVFAASEAADLCANGLVTPRRSRDWIEVQEHYVGR